MAESFNVTISNPRSGMVIYIEPEQKHYFDAFGRLSFDAETSNHFVFKRNVNGPSLGKHSEGKWRIQFRSDTVATQFAAETVKATIDGDSLLICKPTKFRPPQNKNRPGRNSLGSIKEQVPNVIPRTGELVLLTVGQRSLEFRVPIEELFNVSLEWIEKGYKSPDNPSKEQ